jgi:ADP-heptose:LPS heptosyltransferase
MSNGQTGGRLTRFAFSMMGSSGGRNLLAQKVRSRTAGLAPFSFPLNPALYKNVLIMLPSKRLQVLHQLRNLFEIKSFFKGATVTVLAESSCSSLVGLIEGTSIVEYDEEDKKLFSPVFSQFNREFFGTVDLCCILSSHEDLPFLYLAGMTAAPVRVGYMGAGGSPFVNLHINPSPERYYLSDWNCAMAEVIGAKKARRVKWAVAKETVAEMDHMFKEMHLDISSSFIGLDAHFTLRRYGSPWTESFIKTLIPVVKGPLYLYAKATYEPQEMEWLSQFNLPVIHSLTVPQLAALLTRSRLIITGNTLMFGLATLLETRAVGMFDKRYMMAYCPASPVVRGIPFQRTPDAKTIEQAAIAAAELLLIK